jgi:hypothetical protein
MSVFQSALSSARFNRYLMWFSVLVLAAGVAFLVIKLLPSNDKTSVKPDPGFVAKLPAKSQPLTNASGQQIKSYEELDPEVRATIRTFLATAVARKHLDQSWEVVAPSMKKGYTFKSWSHGGPGKGGLPVVPYPIADVDTTQYYLDYASTREILLEVGVSAPRKAGLRPTAFQLGLVPRGKGVQRHWLVNYWMPRWTPPIPSNQ